MSFYARFEEYDGCIFRFDTRVYLNGTPQSETDGHCVAAVIAKNPGSAKPSKGLGWQSINLAGDKMLPSVRKRFVAAYERAGVPIPSLAYVRIWNLFYLCDKKLSRALKAFGNLKNPRQCGTEQQPCDIVWFAWGGEQRLNSLKHRFFLKTAPEHAFFYHPPSEQIVDGVPTPADFVKHIQGMPGELIVDHLAKLIKLRRSTGKQLWEQAYEKCHSPAANDCPNSRKVAEPVSVPPSRLSALMKILPVTK